MNEVSSSIGRTKRVIVYVEICLNTVSTHYTPHHTVALNLHNTIYIRCKKKNPNNTVVNTRRDIAPMWLDTRLPCDGHGSQWLLLVNLIAFNHGSRAHHWESLPNPGSRCWFPGLYIMRDRCVYIIDNFLNWCFHVKVLKYVDIII